MLSLAATIRGANHCFAAKVKVYRFVGLLLHSCAYLNAELGTLGFFFFFQQQKMIFCIFYQFNLTGSGLFK